MGKESVLNFLSNAKKEYVRWVTRAESLMEGLPPGAEQMPVEYTECDFGKWLNGDGQRVGRMPGMDSFRIIEESHKQVHVLYKRIFLVYGSIEKHPLLHKVPKLEKNLLLSKLLTRRRRSSSFEKDIATEYYGELKNASKTLVEAIERLERRVAALPSSSFE